MAYIKGVEPYIGSQPQGGRDPLYVRTGGGGRWRLTRHLYPQAPWRTSQELVATFHTPGVTSGVLRLDLSSPDFDPRGRASLGWGGGLSESTYAKK